MKVVLDTSVLIAAFYSPRYRPSFSRGVFDHLLEIASVHVSPFILQEFREKCVEKLHMTPAETEPLISLLRRVLHEEPEPQPQSIDRLRDPDDVPIASLALSVEADMLMTWDKDLLVLETVGHTRIVSPRQFWDSL